MGMRDAHVTMNATLGTSVPAMQPATPMDPVHLKGASAIFKSMLLMTQQLMKRILLLTVVGKSSFSQER
jgi:hypothetical protein